MALSYVLIYFTFILPGKLNWEQLLNVYVIVLHVVTYTESLAEHKS